MAALDDTIREIEWRDLADTVLVFVCLDTLYSTCLLTWSQDGLFAAFLSAFLVFLIPQLQPNSGDVAMDVLIHISQQLSNSTTPAFEPTGFQVSSYAAAVNVLFFLSLAFVLLDAFLAMLVKGWLQEFDRGWRKFTVAHLRAQERERRLQELERWKLPELVALLPILIQGSLLLFCIGLLVLIFPLHMPSAILSTLAFLFGFGFYGLTTYVSIVNSYAPFSSPVSRLLARGPAVLQSWSLAITRNARRIASAIITFYNRPPLPPQDQQADADPSHQSVQSLPLNSELAKPPELHHAGDAEKSNTLPRSRSDIDPQMHVHVLERLVTTTAEAVENIPIFLELLDQPVKDPTLRPFNVDKWRELLHMTLGLLRDQSTFPASAACTLARTMMICYNRETPDRQLCLTLQHYLRSRETDDRRPRLPLNILFSSYILFWLGDSPLYDICRTIVLLEPSDAADAELLWMVNTFHRTGQVESYVLFFGAVLTYVSSTEQSRRSQVPLTLAVIYAMHTIASALQRGTNPIGGLCILPGNVSTSVSVPMTFSQVDGIDALDLWSEDCIQFVKDILQLYLDAEVTGLATYNEFQLSLIAALYIDSTKRAHARAAFAELLKHTSITNQEFLWLDVYDQGKLPVYQYMAFSKKPLNQDRYPHTTLRDVIRNTIHGLSTLQLSGLHVLDMAVKSVHKTAPTSSKWLAKGPSGLYIWEPDGQFVAVLSRVNYWVLLHLGTLLSPQRYLFPEEVKELKWSDTPEKVHIAKARLVLYDSLEKAEHEEANGPKLYPELLSVFLWSKDHGVCTHAFKWCLNLVPISQPGTLADADSTSMFIPEIMGYEWVEHFIHVLCNGHVWERGSSWSLLISHLVPKWTILTSSWRHHFASAFLFSIVRSDDMHWLPAYQCLVVDAATMPFERLSAFIPFLTTMLELIKSTLTWATLTSLEDWLANLPGAFENRDAQTQIEHILATMKPQILEETLAFFTELPMAGSWKDD